jgi:cytochrome P450
VLNSGVSATEVARRAGHGVAVLLKIYAHCIDGQADAANQRITDALGTTEPEPGPGYEGAVGGTAIVGYLTETIADRMRQPADDMISALTQMDVEGRPLTAEELLDIAYLLFVAGLDTVSGQLSVIMLHLARNPEQQRALRADPSLIDGGIEELVRLHTITPVTRTACRDYVLNGVQIKRGDRIYVGSSAANRDPAEFGDPVEAKFDREGNWSAAFGPGPYRCLGMHLARQELRIALELMTTLAPPFRLAPGATWRWHTGGVWGLDRLDLEFVRDADASSSGDG